MSAKEITLKEFFQENPRVAVAFSGGVDSAYLLHEAVMYGSDVTAYFVKSQFQPEFELEDAVKLIEETGLDEYLEKPLDEIIYSRDESFKDEAGEFSENKFNIKKFNFKVIELDILADENVASNPPDRCYHCKQAILASIINAAHEDGYEVIIDGTNASDTEADRPGMQALKETGVLSPLRICGLTKHDIRSNSKCSGLFTWDKPSYACLATRVPAGQRIDAEILDKIENFENELFWLGFTDFRARVSSDNVVLQVTEDQMEMVITHRDEIIRCVKKYFSGIVLDLEARKVRD